MRLLRITVFWTLSCLCIWATAQNFTDSNLPIVIIETDGNVPIPDEPRVYGNMRIIWHPDGTRNYLTDIDSSQYLNYDGRISIEIRGSTSQEFFEKKPYGLTTLEDDDTSHNNVSLLGLPKENDWILNALAFDETGMRDVMAYGLSEQLGQYAPRCVYCEVMVNGDYRGLYVFMEKIKVDEHRVNVTKTDAACNNYPEVTGGYITKADKPNGDPVAWTMEGNGSGWWWAESVNFIHHYPHPENITQQQNNFIHNVFLQLEQKAGNHDVSITNGIPAVVDVPSFVDFMMVAELTSNVDVYTLSTFFHKDRKGKLRAGPVWDYNLSFGYDAFGSRSRYNVWQFDNEDNNGPRFWKDLFDTGLFRCYLAKRWNELSAIGGPFNYLSLVGRINALDALIAEAIDRDNQRWHKMTNHEASLNDMKNWLQLRINWLNQNIGSYEDCAETDLPPLVISKIHYHPEDYWGISGDQLEFVEITNNGDETVDLTGVYIRELGLTYTFAAGATLAGHNALLLCSDSLAFLDYYNTTPFGQYTRNLSNKSYNLVLADAWGNVIDEVYYYDDEPWPSEADGDGPYLELIDLDLDNSLPENWTVGDDLTKTQNFENEQLVSAFPNPTADVLKVELEADARSCQIISLLGTVVQEKAVTGHSFSLNLALLPSGFYYLKVHLHDGRKAFHKIVKE